MPLRRGSPANNLETSSDSMTTQYELLYIIPATFTDDDVGRVEGNVKALLEKHGATIDSTARLGKFRFAYPIRRVKHGHYMLVRFSSDGASVSAIETALRISQEALRHLILRADEAGGEKFDLVQFTEVNLDTRDERPRRPLMEKSKTSAEIKSAVAVLERPTVLAPAPIVEVPELSAEALEKKIEAALEEKI